MLGASYAEIAAESRSQHKSQGQGSLRRKGVIMDGVKLEAQRRLNVLLAGTRPDDIEAARARLERLESQQSDLTQQYGKLSVVSPVAGIVATPSRDLKAMKRQLIGSGGLIAKVYDFETVAAQIRVPEKEIGEVRPGLPVELRTRANPDVTFQGRVTSIAVAADATPVTEAASPLPVTDCFTSCGVYSAIASPARAPHTSATPRASATAIAVFTFLLK